MSTAQVAPSPEHVGRPAPAAPDEHPLIAALGGGLYRVRTPAGVLVEVQLAAAGNDGISVAGLLALARELLAGEQRDASQGGLVVRAAELRLAESYLGEARACVLEAYLLGEQDAG